MAILTKFLEFEILEFGNKKTGTWYVYSKNTRAQLGIVKWYAQWRQYVFSPHMNTLFNHECLDEISRFIRDEMHHYKYDKPIKERMGKK